MIGQGRRLGAIAALVVMLSSVSALANPFIIENPQPDWQFQSVFMLRYWYGFDSTSKDLYGANWEALVSWPTYDGMQTHTLEAYTCVDHMSGLFWKGCVGGGLLTQGNLLTQYNLHDENFLPAISPYTSTDRMLQNQPIGYINTDFGGTLLRGPTSQVVGFVSYHYFHQHTKSFGGQQTATNLVNCAGRIPYSMAAIEEDDRWQMLRVGLNADVPLVDRIRLNLEGAWLPYIWFSGTDNHLLRLDLPIPIRENGRGSGYQLEAILSY